MIMHTRNNSAAAQRGMVLVSSLLLLIVVTIMALAMFRSYGIQEKIAGNLREKQRAFHAAVTAQEYAEYWLSQGTNATQAAVNCAALLNANIGQGQICANTFASAGVSPASVPWKLNGNPVGVTYAPPSMNPAMNVTTAANAGTYYAAPTFYIADLGKSASAQGEVFQVDAFGYGATSATVAVVESTYQVGPQVQNLGGL